MPNLMKKKLFAAKTAKKYAKKKAGPQIKSVKRLISKEIRKNEETKWIDNIYAAADINWTAANTFYDLTEVNAGATSSTRIGDRIRFKSLHFQLMINRGVTGSAAVPTFVRVIIFQWHPDDATPPTPTSIITAIAEMQCVINPYVVNNTGRGAAFSVFHDKVHKLDAYGPHGICQDFLLTGHKFLQREIHYNTGVVTGMNNIYMMLLSNQATSSTTGPTFTGRVRLRYTDS